MGKTLDGDVYFSDVGVASQFLHDRQIVLNRVADVRQSFFFGIALREAARQAGAGNVVAFFGMAENDFVGHGLLVRIAGGSRGAVDRVGRGRYGAVESLWPTEKSATGAGE